jgi:fumarate reductase flavoprotein subunit
MADILVVGAGTAGLACAILAAQAGATVAVLEKDAVIGGTLQVSAGHLSGAGTRRQHEVGIDDDTTDRHFDDVMRLSRGEADPALVRLAVEEALHTIDWLHDLGFAFDPATPAIYLGHDAYSRARTVWHAAGPGQNPASPLGRAVGILETLRPAWDEQVAAGRIVPHFSTALTGLIVEAGAVVGVRATGPAGSADFRSPSTVLATGGYGASPELFAELTPGRPRLVTHAWHTASGDGIVAAREAGAAIRGGDKHNYRLGMIEVEPGSGRGELARNFVGLSAAARRPDEIWVNERGDRFVDETTHDITAQERAVLGQPGHRFWLVFDEVALAGPQAPVPAGWDRDAVRARADEGVFLWRDATVAGLAAQAGIDPDGLERTLTAYNARVAAATPDPLGRTGADAPLARGPFYALALPAGVLVTFAGIHVDAQLRALDTAGRPIPGLYAAGEVIGGGATSGIAFCGGMLITPALSFGRILGRTLAAAATATAVAGRA